MKQIKLKGTRRDVFGKQVRTLRRHGILPARVYGPHLAPIHISLNAAEFQRVWPIAGTVSLVDLDIDVPVVFVGESPAVRQGGVLLRTLDVLEVECLPAKLPRQIDVGLSALGELESAIHVRDLILPNSVAIVTPPDELVVKVAAPSVRPEAAPAREAVVETAAAAPPEEHEAES